MKSKYVYTVEKGSYSDYMVVAVCSTKANAELVANRLNANSEGNSEGSYMPRGYATVVERELDMLVDYAKLNYKYYSIYMLRDGTSLDVSEREYDAYDDPGLQVWIDDRYKSYRYKSSGIVGYVFAKHVEHAIKIANDFRAQAIAENRL